MRGGHRLFFALWPDDAVRAAIAEVAQRLLPTKAQGRRTRVERLHMTVQFLGDFDSPPDTAVDKAIAAAMSIEPPMEIAMTLDRLGNFGRGRVVWLGSSATPGQLLELHRRLGDALAARGLTPKHADMLVPHVTLARDAREVCDAALPALQWRARDFVLVDSTSGEYRILGRWPSPAAVLSRGCRNPAAR